MRENSEMMRAWPQKNKLHFFRKDGFISIGFGNIKCYLDILPCLVLSIISGRILLLANYLMGWKEKRISDRKW